MTCQIIVIEVLRSGVKERGWRRGVDAMNGMSTSR